MIEEDYTAQSYQEITKKITGKIVKEFVDREGMNDKLVIIFTDGSELVIEYDWIYGYEFVEGVNDKGSQGDSL